MNYHWGLRKSSDLLFISFVYIVGFAAFFAAMVFVSYVGR